MKMNLKTLLATLVVGFVCWFGVAELVKFCIWFFGG